jgi:Tol biopolymer transport system component
VRRLLLCAVVLLAGACGRGKTTLDTGPESIPKSIPSELTTTSTTGPAPTTSTSAIVGGDPCERPDRGRILFQRTMPSPEPIWHVFSINADGTCLRQITQGTTHVLNWGASWSPDGSRIAFIRKDAGVMVADWNGEHERLVLRETKVQPSGAHTDWSPDGTRLVAEREDGVWVIDVATGAAKLLEYGGYPSWAPDGKRVVFTEFGAPSGQNYSTVTMKPDGSDRRVVCECGSQPDWGANNRIVYFGADVLRVVGPAGTNDREVQGSRDCGAPRWNRDATRIVCSIGPGGMKVFDPDKGFLFVVNTGAGADTSGGQDYANDW